MAHVTSGFRQVEILSHGIYYTNKSQSVKTYHSARMKCCTRS